MFCQGRSVTALARSENPPFSNRVDDSSSCGQYFQTMCAYRWIDDAMFYEDIEDRYHLISLTPSASTYLGFPLFEDSPADLPPLVVD